MPEEQKVTRKLRAIMSADVKGYSLLIADDEAFTIRKLEEYRTHMSNLVQANEGRVVDAVGDNLLAEFSSAVNAVQCAVEIQKTLKEKNENLPDDKKLKFRIGVNIGDVVQDGDRIYGSGVNVAARIEGLAEPGGVCISRNAYDHIRDKLDLGFEYLGEHSVKNIKQPVRVYKVLMDPEDAGKLIGVRSKPSAKRWVLPLVAAIVVLFGIIAWQFYQKMSTPEFEPASVDKMAYPLPDKPSIAVLPFDNLSGDPEQEYFIDGLSDQIISTISKLRNLFVIARNSTFTYKGKSVKVQKVAEDLGVRYVLEGSVQKTADRLRIIAQLIDAITGHQIWSERYDRQINDIFAIQDDITMEITKALRIELIEGEQARIWGKHETSNLAAYEKRLLGTTYFVKGTKEDIAKARHFLKEAITLDPNYADAYAALGYSHFFDWRFRWVSSPDQSLKMASECAQKAVELDGTLDNAHTLLGTIYLMKGQDEKAIAEGELALTFNPNGALNYAYMAGIMGLLGRWNESVEFGEKSIRLSPFPRIYYYHWLGRAYFMTEQYDEAIDTWKKALRINPNYLPAQAFLAACYSSLDREVEAAAAAEEVLRINPKFTLESYAKTLPYKIKPDIERYISALRKAGLPNTSTPLLSEKPSIAVLPFVNMSGDPEQEYFSDGLSEEIITALSKTSKLFVIARNSSFIYKGKPVKVQQINRELGVKYVLEGSVRKSDNRVRITAQLVDAENGNHLWADRYDRQLKDLFVLQDDITMKVITALEVKLTEGEQARITGSGTDNLDAYLKVLQARDLKRNQNIENNHKARQFVEEAIRLDSDYAQAYRWLSGTYLMDVWLGSSESPQESLKTAIELSKKALSLDDSLGGAHGLLGNIYIMKKDYKNGIREAKRAVELEPNGADAHAFLGMGLLFADRQEEAIPILKKAIRLDPNAPEWYMHVLASAYRDIKKYEQAMEWGEKAVQKNPQNVLSRQILCSIYSLADRMDQAHAQAKEIVMLNPNISVERIARTYPQKNQDVKNRYIEALRKAGLPE